MTKVFIGVPTGEFARRADFYDYLNALQKPDGTVMAFTHGQSPAKNRNILIRMALEHEASHILLVDDDMALPPDTIPRLLAHDKDIVGGLYLHRNYPHFPLAFSERFDDGRCVYKFLTPGTEGLSPVVNMGFGCVLIKIDVFKTLSDPWVTLGHYEKDGWCDDIHFFNKCRDAGYEMFIDNEICCGHMITAIIVPRRDENSNWFTLYNTNSVEGFQVPQVAPTKEQYDTKLREAGYSNPPTDSVKERV